MPRQRGSDTLDGRATVASINICVGSTCGGSRAQPCNNDAIVCHHHPGARTIDREQTYVYVRSTRQEATVGTGREVGKVVKWRDLELDCSRERQTRVPSGNLSARQMVIEGLKGQRRATRIDRPARASQPEPLRRTGLPVAIDRSWWPSGPAAFPLLVKARSLSRTPYVYRHCSLNQLTS